MARSAALLAALALTASTVTMAQQPGHQGKNTQPPLTMSTCTKGGGCTKQQKAIQLDSNWLWTHKVGTTTNCFTGNEWDTSLCPDPTTCASNCALDASDYSGTYGITTSDDQVKLGFVTQGPYSRNVGSRTYLMDSQSSYFMFKLKNQEFSFDVDVSQLPCGLNGALYFVDMDADGGMARYPGNKAGAAYGTGYCDAQCPHDIKFINGEANVEGWNPSPTDPNAGTGKYGTCCTEMDVWEANSISEAVTPHACKLTQQTRCSGTQCGDDSKGQRDDGVCDKDGGDFNPYRLGDTTFFGPGSSFKIDTTQKMTVTTQWITSDGTATGELTEIRRSYTQNGKTIPVDPVTVGGKAYTSITDEFINATKKAFGDPNTFEARGGLKGVGAAMDDGMVLVMSLWDDHAAYMLWLDSTYPVDKAGQPGAARGTCATSSGRPKDVESQHPNAYVAYSNIRFGDIGSTTGPN